MLANSLTAPVSVQAIAPYNYVWIVADIEESYLEKICNSPAARTALLGGGIVLNKGQSVVKGGDNGEVIHLDVADVEVPPHGMVVLQNSDKSRIGVISFTEAERGVVTISLRGQGTYQVPNGTQLVVELPNNYSQRLPQGANTNLTHRLPQAANTNLTQRLPQGANTNLTQRLPQGASTNLTQRLPQGADTNLTQRLPQGANTDLTQRLPQDANTNLTQRLPQGANTNLTQRLPQGASTNLTQRLPQGANTNPTQRLPQGANTNLTQRLPQGANTNLTQRLPQGANTNLTQRLPQGANTNLTQRLPQGANTNLTQRLPQGANTNLTQRLPQGANTNLTQRLPQSANTNLTQRLPQSANTNLTQRLPQGANTNLTQRLPQGANTNLTQRLPQGTSTNIVPRETENAVVIQRFPFGQYKDLTAPATASKSSAQAPTQTSAAPETAQGELPRLMRAIVKMPEEVPKDMIWASTYHHFRYWLPTHPHGAVGGAVGQEQLSSRPDVRPISFSTVVPAPAKNIMMTEGSRVIQQNGALVLENGSAVFGVDPQQRIIYTPHGSVSIARGAVVMVTVTPMLTYIRNLYDNSTHDVTATINNYKVGIKPGQEVALINGPSKDQVFDLVYADGVARRDMAIKSVNPEKHVAISDFSHVNLLMNNPILQSLRHSNADSDKRLYKKLEKMAAVITTVHDRTRAPYEVPFEPVDKERLAVKSSSSQL